MKNTVVVRGVATGVGILLATTASVLASVPTAAAATCGSGVATDVNGDGHAEVVVGSDYSRTGGVHVFYGKSSGLVTDKSGAALDDQYFSQATTGVPGTARPYDGFGASPALGDLNGDGCADLAIGAPSAALAGEIETDGTVTILYGSPSGLTTQGAQRFTSEQVLGPTDGFEGFGGVLVMADFDQDKLIDLAVGTGSGSVAVLYGASDGLGRGRATDVLSRASTGLGELFGGGDLVAGDFDGDDRLELAVGGRDAITTVERGPGGFAGATPRVLTKASFNAPDPDETDGFGGVLAAGDVNTDGTSDLAVGVPKVTCDEEFPSSCGPGAVLLVPGSSAGLVPSQRQLWTQDSAGMSGTARDEDGFGASLVMGRFDAGSTVDLAIGTPNDSVGSVKGAGSVSLLLGSSSGLTTAGVGGSRLHQDTAGIPSAPSGGEAFGGALAAAPIQSPAQDNLVIGVQFQKVSAKAGAGQVHQLARSAAGPRGTGGVTLHLDRPGVKGKAAVNSWFGWSLS